MNHIKALGFDLFNTLITVRPDALTAALERLTGSLGANDIAVDIGTFSRDHRRAAFRFIKATRRDGRETHNRYWISAALKEQGYEVSPEDPRLAEAVDAYFSAFFDFSTLIPGTKAMLASLKQSYPLGLLSNFTHAPAAKTLLDNLGLSTFFDLILISGEVGYRKPHPFIFERLSAGLGFSPEQIAYIGDDPEPDVEGAINAGLQPIWMTYVRDMNIPFAPGVASEQAVGVDGGVPRISEWNELCALLGKG